MHGVFCKHHLTHIIKDLRVVEARVVEDCQQHLIRQPGIAMVVIVTVIASPPVFWIMSQWSESWRVPKWNQLSSPIF